MLMMMKTKATTITVTIKAYKMSPQTSECVPGSQVLSAVVIASFHAKLATRMRDAIIKFSMTEANRGDSVVGG